MTNLEGARDAAADYHRILTLPRARRREMARAYQRLLSANGSHRAWGEVWPLFRRATHDGRQHRGDYLPGLYQRAIERVNALMGRSR
jgi:hypothetical protein